MKNNLNISDNFIQSSIHIVRGFKVILDEDLAKLYGVSVKRLNEQVKRNLERFPSDFRFQLTDDEITLRSQNATSKNNKKGGRTYLPYAFTEQGVAMLSGLLRTPQAIAVNIEIMRTFVKMRHFLENQSKLNKKFDELKSFLLKKSQSNTAEFKRIWKAIDSLSEDPNEERKIGFKLNHDESG